MLAFFKPMFYYFGFGINIKSEIEFPELVETERSDSSLMIRIGTIPEISGGISFSSSDFTYVIQNNEFLFTVNNVAKYYAKNGNEIIVEILNPEVDGRSIRLYILATVMAAILLQKNKLPFHASAIIRDNNLLLISGESGAGKSTLLASLINNGHTVFCDDILVLSRSLSNSKIIATASYPMIKLWEDSIEKLNNAQFSNRSFRIRHDLNKYGFFFHNTFDKRSYPIEKIIILKKGNQTQFVLNKIKDTEAFIAVSKQIYRPFLIQSIENKTLSFKLISDLISNVDVLEITRPVDSKPKDLLEFIESNLRLRSSIVK
ncbi:hypothetical protein DYBT9275_03894 [Dyadobacter sp. CECT 9275]|uniref:Uncharacterized protein n=1 Tax=Dyadobacter helix TaxID=2822344 RepID=A0A916JIE6_9BACT|nr:hypothetical protein [Dyadobacter sp. CECT 9275]CAG5006778.1 hypothetical protein DYBT9275_03894 [Dyadobacter sp. CECT 9275]